jgi:hypothetical protein
MLDRKIRVNTGTKGGGRRFLVEDEPAQIGETIGDLQRLGLKPSLRCVGGRQLHHPALNVGELVGPGICQRARRSEVLVGPARLETAGGDVPYMLANLPCARAIGLADWISRPRVKAISVAINPIASFMTSMEARVR